MTRCDECGKTSGTETLICMCGSRDTALKLCGPCLDGRPEVTQLGSWTWQSTSAVDICDDCDGSHRATTGEW